MKYTVIIREPVPENDRGNLESALISELGVSASAAEKLASRRSGRLLKPTSRAKAEQLLRIFESVGAKVELGEVPSEDESGAQRTLSGESIPETLVIGAAVSGPTSAGDDPFGTPLVTSLDDPFGDPFGTSSSSGSNLTMFDDEDPADMQPVTASDEKSISAELQSLETPAGQGNQAVDEDDPWADFASSLGGGASTEVGDTAGDDPWADFAQGLQVDVPETSMVSEERPAPLVGTLMDIDESAPVARDRGERRELTQEFITGLFVPLGAMAALILLAVLVLTPAEGRVRVAFAVLLLLGGGIGWAYKQAGNLVRELVVQPLGRLLTAAKAISEGNLDRPVTPDKNDEVGDVAEALDGMRLSLDAAMSRLRRKR